MINFQDRTFCDFHKNCKNGVNCKDALTEEIQNEAIKWWGSQDAPISVYQDKPKCYKSNEE